MLKSHEAYPIQLGEFVSLYLVYKINIWQSKCPSVHTQYIDPFQSVLTNLMSQSP